MLITYRRGEANSVDTTLNWSLSDFEDSCGFCKSVGLIIVELGKPAEPIERVQDKNKELRLWTEIYVSQFKL